MPGELKKGVARMVEEARQRIEQVDAVDAISLHTDPTVVIVDLRDVRERQREGYIPGSFHCPRGMVEFWVDPQSPYFKAIFARDARFVFHCASGWRSALTVATLQDMGFENCAHITHGFTSWREAGGPLEFPES
ncbi:MAG: rhodanese-like domain-containing protein [Halieaceae bacterium]|nr:rhodanese-like domain-containing protein [Halieaceae bacterium]MCP5194803.1 rhodanese-like domain-containing protein [Pseudomonadales bacterium]